MSGHIAQRTLVKSPPELWAELSDAAALAKHLGEFGEIRITRLEPETVVAWEGERANGTVSLEPAGWGTKVTITASAVVVPASSPEPVTVDAPAAVSAPAPSEAAEPEASVATEPEAAPAATKLTLFGRFRRWLTPGGDARIWQLSDELPPAQDAQQPDGEPSSEPAPPTPIRREPRPPEPDPEPPAAAEAEPVMLAELAIAGVLTEALDTLGAAHHRPFSRS